MVTTMETTLEAASLHAVSDLISKMAKALVDRPEDVFVEIVETPPGLTMKLGVAPDDLGKIIGKQGRTARAFRVILMAASMRKNRHVCLDIVATCPQEAHHPQLRHFVS